MIRILLLLTLAISSSGQTSSFDEKFLVTLRSNILRYAEHHFYPYLREKDVSNDLETRSKSGTVTRSLNRPGDQILPVYNMLISKDLSAQFESGVGAYKMLISQDLSTKLKRNVNQGSGWRYSYRMLIATKLSSQLEINNKIPSKMVEVRNQQANFNNTLRYILPAISKRVLNKYGRSAYDVGTNATDILLKMFTEGVNTTQQSEFSEMLNILSLLEDIISSRHNKIPNNLEHYHSQWIYLLNIFPINGLSKHRFQTLLNPLAFEASAIGAHFIDFSKLFWPFTYKLCDNNQKLAIVGMTGELMNRMNQKTTFFEELSKLQNMKIPADENKIIYSFDDEELVKGMNRTGMETFDKDFVQNGSHLFTKDEREEITRATDAALNLINSTLPEVYKAINRLVGCIAFYKSQKRIHMGGTISSAVGLIWLDPSTQHPWPVPLYAEQIVHEFIHTSLFYADLVHGMFRDPSRLSEAKVISAIRRQMRDYDKSLHAAYVSAGLVTFHARAGYFERALALAEPLERSVKDLEQADREHDVLDESGKAILKSLVDYLVAMRLYN